MGLVLLARPLGCGEGGEQGILRAEEAIESVGDGLSLRRQDVAGAAEGREVVVAEQEHRLEAGQVLGGDGGAGQRRITIAIARDAGSGGRGSTSSVEHGVRDQWGQLSDSPPNVLNVLQPFRTLISPAVNTAGALVS